MKYKLVPTGHMVSKNYQFKLYKKGRFFWYHTDWDYIWAPTSREAMDIVKNECAPTVIVWES